MMLQILHKILAFILALAVLFSTLSFTVEKHVCMGDVTDVSYFKRVEACEMEMMECEVGDAMGHELDRSRCCDNIQELIPGESPEQLALDRLEIQQFDFVLAFVSSYVNSFEHAKHMDRFDFGPDPPLIERDVQIPYQTFLI